MKTDSLRSKYDTCFFERYAKATLVTILGESYAGLVNLDRPDLQDVSRGLGIEVTRAMNESKADAISLLNEMAADVVVRQPEMTNHQLYSYGYTYGLVDGFIVGPAEYRYWCEASPLNHVIENKVSKMIRGFYGHFERSGLYIFSKDDITVPELMLSLKRVNELQSGSDLRFDTLYISEIQTLYVCDVVTMSYTSYPISDEMCRHFFDVSVREG